MLSIRTVLCPVDFSAATPRQIHIAADICRGFSARLVLHHNLVELAIGAGVGWMWAIEHSDYERKVAKRLVELVPQVPAGVTTDVRLTRGPVVDGILAVGRAEGADLVVLATRGAVAALDASVTERVLEHAERPVLAVHDAREEHQAPRFSPSAGRQTLLVPTDFTAASRPALDAAFDLARRFAFDVLVLHVVPEAARHDRGALDDARRRLAALVPLEYPERVEGRVEHGVPARVIADVAREVSAACIVMGEHVRTPLRHWFRPDTSRGVLHPAPCPIWYVPAERPAAVAGVDDRAPLPTDAAPQRLVHALHEGLFHFWPAHRLYAVVDSPDEAESTLADLLRAGVRQDQLRTWYGADGQAALDATGEKHGRTARLWRTLEKATPERDLLDRYAAEVERGHVCIGVRCGAEEGHALAPILQKHGGHLITHFSMGAVERLSP